MTRTFFSALALSGLFMVTLWGIAVMARNSLAIIGVDNPVTASDQRTESAPQENMGQMSDAAGRIAFSQKGRIATAMADGTMAAFLTKGPGDYSPVWSPDGSKLAFVAAGVGGRSGLFVISADGKEERQVAPAAALHSQPSWSPDNRRLVFHDTVKERQGIYIVNADGAELKRIFQGNTNTPLWSPDGRWIAFTFNPKPTEGGLYVTDPDGADPKVVLGGVFSQFAWSPDSNALSVRGLPWPTGKPESIQSALILRTGQVVIAHRSPGQATVLTTDAAGGNWSPVWSPDGKTVAVIIGTEGKQQLLAVSLTGRPHQVLAQEPGFASPVWSPDGREVAVGIPAGPNAESHVLIAQADGAKTREFALGEFPSWAK